MRPVFQSNDGRSAAVVKMNLINALCICLRTYGVAPESGTAGMYNNAHVITHVNNIRENESREVTQESRAVHCWYVELWTFDSNKPKQTIVTSSNSSGGTDDNFCVEFVLAIID